jgi:hypothetical protein
VTEAVAEPASFRDPSGRVYHVGDTVIRGVDAPTLAHIAALEKTAFYRELVSERKVVGTSILPPQHAMSLPPQDWAGTLLHERVACITYPYEWSFSMLKDAALLQLEILERAFGEGWTLKDSTPFNVQFAGVHPVFIDTPSFVPRVPGDYWRGYRQFCMLYLYPLMMKSHLGIEFSGLLRSNLDGISAGSFASYFAGLNRLRAGVFSHVLLPAALERNVERRERGDAKVVPRPQINHSDAMVIGLLQSMRRLVGRLRTPRRHTDWSDYASKNSYDADALAEKRAFVDRHAGSQRWSTTWDIGSNTGTFSLICAPHSDHVLAIDGDAEAIERLYLELRQSGPHNLLPLVQNLANISPSQGWAGKERAAFDARNRPDLVLCLAVIHHMALASNVPIPMFLDWLASLGAKLIIEFVDRDDPMVRKLLANKTEQYADYNKDQFERALLDRFVVEASQPLKGGLRQLYFCSPRVTDHPA